MAGPSSDGAFRRGRLIWTARAAADFAHDEAARLVVANDEPLVRLGTEADVGDGDGGRRRGGHLLHFIRAGRTFLGRQHGGGERGGGEKETTAVHLNNVVSDGREFVQMTPRACFRR